MEPKLKREYDIIQERFHSLDESMQREQVFVHFSGCLNGALMVEIGTDFGNFATFMLRTTKNSKLFCIDPYLRYEDYEDAINQVTGDKLYANTLYRLKSEHHDRVQFVRGLSYEVVDQIPSNLRFLYIDGNHKYKYVKQELELYYDKIIPGGIIIGDDAVDVDESKRDKEGDVFIEWSPDCYGKYGVYKAFKEFVESRQIVSWKLIGTQFVVVKPQ